MEEDNLWTLGSPMCFKCNKKGHIAKDCKGKQIMRKRKVQEESDDEDNKEEEKGFGKDLE